LQVIWLHEDEEDNHDIGLSTDTIKPIIRSVLSRYAQHREQDAYHKSCIAEPDRYTKALKALDEEEAHDEEIKSLDSSKGFTGEELKPGA
jgi:hypothetical protein